MGDFLFFISFTSALMLLLGACGGVYEFVSYYNSEEARLHRLDRKRRAHATKAREYAKRMAKARG